MSEKNKALFHAALIVAGALELLTTRSRLRALLVGACTGWHVVATYQHIRDMRKEKHGLHTSVHGRCV